LIWDPEKSEKAADCLQIFLKVESLLMAVTQLIIESRKKNPEGLEKLPLYL